MKSAVQCLFQRTILTFDWGNCRKNKITVNVDGFLDLVWG